MDHTTYLGQIGMRNAHPHQGSPASGVVLGHELLQQGRVVGPDLVGQCVQRVTQAST